MAFKRPDEPFVEPHHPFRMLARQDGREVAEEIGQELFHPGFDFRAVNIRRAFQRKGQRIQQIVMENKLPVVNLVESGGANLLYQAEIFVPGGRGFANQARMSARGIPQVTVVHGDEDALVPPARGRELVELIPGAVAAPIAGARVPEQVDPLIEGTKLQLSGEQLGRLTAAG